MATETRSYTRAVEGTGAKILDTRKTTPGLRMLQKYAVVVGGGHNHRFGLDDGVLIKDNHVAAAGGVGAAVRSALFNAPLGLKVEVEVTTFAELDERCPRRACHPARQHVPRNGCRGGRESQRESRTRGVGGINLRPPSYAVTGMECISVGR